jgi:hypothetical protein
MPTLRLSLSGLCTFIFDPPLNSFEFEPDRKFKEVTVLFQRLTRARLLSNLANNQPEVLDQHFPLLEFSLDDLRPESTRTASFACSPEGGALTKGVCLLNGEDVSILPDGAAANGGVGFSRLKPADQTNPLLSQPERESLYWMVTLEDALPGNSALNPRLIETPPGSNQPILAKMHLTKGRLKTRNLTDQAYTIGGSGRSSRINRRVATAFELELDFGKSVTVNMKGKRNGKPTDEDLVLAPTGAGELQVGIGNMEIDRFIGLDPATGPRVQADFEVHFDLLQNPIAQGQPRPFLQLAARDGSSTQGGVSSCAPAGSG